MFYILVKKCTSSLVQLVDSNCTSFFKQLFHSWQITNRTTTIKFWENAKEKQDNKMHFFKKGLQMSKKEASSNSLLSPYHGNIWVLSSFLQV